MTEQRIFGVVFIRTSVSFLWNALTNLLSFVESIFPIAYLLSLSFPIHSDTLAAT